MSAAAYPNNGLSAVGRRELEERLVAAERRLELQEQVAAAALIRVERERDAYLENLSATQCRCNEILAAYRASKFVDGRLEGTMDDRLWEAMLVLAGAIVRARDKHPRGPDYRSLLEEAGEAAKAQRYESEERERADLLDTACVALRMWLGERCDRTKETP
jgi:hypothetical protein